MVPQNVNLYLTLCNVTKGKDGLIQKYGKGVNFISKSEGVLCYFLFGGWFTLVVLQSANRVRRQIGSALNGTALCPWGMDLNEAGKRYAPSLNRNALQIGVARRPSNVRKGVDHSRTVDIYVPVDQQIVGMSTFLWGSSLLSHRHVAGRVTDFVHVCSGAERN